MAQTVPVSMGPSGLGCCRVGLGFAFRSAKSLPFEKAVLLSILLLGGERDGGRLATREEAS